MKNDKIKPIMRNRKAFSLYTIIEHFEAGIVLVGTEVKSIRDSKIAFKDSYARFYDNELFLEGFYIAPYEQGNFFNHTPERKRKLLLTKKELKRLKNKVEEKGFTIVPLSIYLKAGLVKVEIGLAQGKKLYDKREDIKKRDQQREMQRDLKESLKKRY
ncbi:MAG: SsrA-binding protein SmpB [Candidatus Coatesbacteria bacterium]|nr:SsrA-binding protein SmpB [Candidatus Coatesbacteria bacterium]